ncbi:MAG: hypothetical protein ACYC48_00430 [Minisyncoccota bacterium]
MLTNEDKNWVTEQLTKELKPVRDSVDLLRKKVSENSLDRLHSDARLNAIEASQMRVEEKVDSFDKDIIGLKTDIDKNIIGLKTDIDKNIIGLKTDITELKVESSLLQQAVLHLEQGQDEIRSLVTKTLTTVQGFAGNVATLEQENKMGALTLRRHDIQIHELAHATRTTISE